MSSATELESLAADEQYMRLALDLAQQGAVTGEVPVGAVLVLNGEIIAQGYNQPISACDPTAHAEIVAMRKAAAQLSNYRLIDTTLYVTLEPCAMCAGAMVQARVKRLVFGASEPRSGASGSVMDVLSVPDLNHRLEVVSGVLREESANILRKFFREKRGALK